MYTKATDADFQEGQGIWAWFEGKDARPIDYSLRQAGLRFAKKAAKPS